MKTKEKSCKINLIEDLIDFNIKNYNFYVYISFQ